MSATLLSVVKAEYAYEAQTEDELTVQEHDLLYVLEDDDSEWWKVRIKTAPSEDASSAPSGLVPATYVTPLPSLAQVSSLYAYEPQNDEELSVAEDEPLHLYERDGDWILVGKQGNERGVGYIPANWVDETGAEVPDATRDPSPPPIATTSLSEPKKATFLPPPTRNMAASSPRPGAEAKNVQTWNVTEVDAKKKKKKGTLGIGNGALFFASESDKTPVQQHSLTDYSSHRTEKDKHLYLDFSGTELHFSIPSKTELDEIIAKIEDLSVRSASPAPQVSGSTPIRSMSGARQANGVTQVYATVLYDFTGEGEDELSVVDGERVIVLDSSADDWWKVQRTDVSAEEGVVPASYVDLDAAAADDDDRGDAGDGDDDDDDRQGLRARSSASAKVAAAAASASRARSRSDVEASRRPNDARKAAQPPPLARRPSSRERREPPSKARQSSEGRREEPKKPAGKTRLWRDRTGQFKVEAEFLGIQNGKVRLHKLNGVIIAVPLSKMSVEDTEYLERLERQSTRAGDDGPSSSRTRDSRTAADSRSRDKTSQPKRATIDWFEFFLNAGCDMDDCTRYARNFDKDRIDETVLTELEASTLRSLGLREGDVIRVMKHIKAHHMPKAADRRDDDLTRDLQERDSASSARDGTGLFTNASGGLKSTRRGRPTGGRTAPEKVSIDALTMSNDPRAREADATSVSATPLAPTQKTLRRSSSTTPVASGFDDDAWTNRPASRNNSAISPAAPSPPPLPVKPAHKAQDVEPSRPASATTSAASAAHDLNESILRQLGISNRPPSAPVLGGSASVAQTPANGPRGPLAPVVGNAPLLNPLVPTQTGNLGFVPTRPGGMTSPIAPQMTAFSMQPQATGYQTPMMSQPTGYMPPMMSSASAFGPAQPYQQQQPAYQPPIQQRPSYNDMSFSQPTYGANMVPQATGWNGTSNAVVQPQQTGYAAQPPMPQPSQQPMQSSAPARFDPSNVFGSMKQGTFGKDPSAQPQSEDKYNALRPQMTGFAPGGVISGGLVAQPTGVFANWQTNPMAQQQQQQQQQPYQRYY